MADKGTGFRPFVSPQTKMAEFTVKSILTGAAFGIVFGAATVYLALKAGLTVSASIPIGVIAITLGRRFLKTTILENNIIQTTGSAGESIAAGVVFTLPGFLFLSQASSANYFNYFTILILAIFGGMLGTLMMIPLRRSLIVKEHGVLPYPEGTACASVLKAGERGGEFAKTAFLGLGSPAHMRCSIASASGRPASDRDGRTGAPWGLPTTVRPGDTSSHLAVHCTRR